MRGRCYGSSCDLAFALLGNQRPVPSPRAHVVARTLGYRSCTPRVALHPYLNGMIPSLTTE
eukprot:1523184-Alexandrium_andersonii.AAC.1